MSESELDAILNEIRTRGNGDSPMSEDEAALKRAMQTFSTPNEPEPEPTYTQQDPTKVVNDLLYEITGPSAPAEPANPVEPAGDDTNEFVSASSLKFGEATEPDDEMDYPAIDNGGDAPKKGNKKPLIIIIAIILLIAIGAGIYFGFFAGKKDGDNGITKADKIATQGNINPLTGEDGFNKNALDQRPVAIVVENEYSSAGVRPQWGIDEADIVLEGESECSTRTLLFWADYNTVPEKVGPTRSARPPFIHFSQLFDSVFIHNGLSHSKDNYEGADTVFQNEMIDHIDLMKEETNGYFIGRDSSRTDVVEHTEYLNGTNLDELLQKKDINTTLEPSRFSNLNFNKEPKDVGKEDGSYAYFKWSSECPDSIEVEYDEDEQVYTTTHFDSASTGEVSNCKWTNCIFLLDTTEYIKKENYKSSGNSETYCDYMLEGGDGMILSHGKAVKIKWGLENGKLFLKDAETGKDVFLNPGKSYIGYGSSNHDGKISLTEPKEDESTTNEGGDYDYDNDYSQDYDDGQDYNDYSEDYNDYNAE